MDRIRPILVLEVNEVPAKVYDWLRGRYPHFRHLNRFLGEAVQGASVAVDGGELSPWMTWPTFHRGLPATEHGILHLGQDPNSFKGTPIWSEFRARGKSIGICGPLQSWPPSDPGAQGFYFPDTFSADSQTLPEQFRSLQEFNLSFVRENGRVRDGGFLKHLINPSLWLNLSHLRIQTLKEISLQLLMERFDKYRYERRATFQSKIFFDLFRSLYSFDTPPAYGSFFTNHIAGLLHRHWIHLFPEDFESKPSPKPQILREFEFAFQLLDEMINFAFAAQARNPDLIIVLASCIGQQAIQRKDHEGFELLLKEPQLLLDQMGVTDARINLAMAPQVALEFPSEAKARDFAAKIRGLCWGNGTPVFLCEVIGPSISLTCKTPAKETLDSLSWKGTSTTFNKWGLALVKVEAGTAYHIAEGPLFVFAKGSLENGLQVDERVIATDVKERMMAWSNLSTSVGR
jgi:hypothetical protein